MGCKYVDLKLEGSNKALKINWFFDLIFSIFQFYNYKIQTLKLVSDLNPTLHQLKGKWNVSYRPMKPSKMAHSLVL